VYQGLQIGEHLRVWVVELLAKHHLAYLDDMHQRLRYFPLQLHFPNLLAAQMLIHS
jgi:hypothetical protein